MKKKKLRSKYLTTKEVFCDCECHVNKNIFCFMGCCGGTECPNCKKLLLFYYNEKPLDYYDIEEALELHLLECCKEDQGNIDGV